MDKMGIENKENANENNHPPKFMLPSISNLPNPSSLTPFQQMNNHESADAILRGSSVQATFSNQSSLGTRSPTQPFEGSIKQETKASTPKFYLPNPSTTYDPNTSYATTYWPAYYSDYPYQSSRDINGSTGPPYNVSTWFASDNVPPYNNRQDYSRSPIPTRSFIPYYHNNRHLPPLAPNLHSVINSSPSSHHLGNNYAFTGKKFGTKDVKDEGNDEIEGIKVQRASIKSSSSDNIDPVLLGLEMKEDYDETPLSIPNVYFKTEGNKDKKKGRSNWSRKETRSLITAVKSKYKLLLAAQRNAEKSRIWSDMFSDHCARYSGRTLKAFKLRWSRLVADYNSVHECIKTGVEPMDFDFYEEMKEILGDEAVADNTTGLTEEGSISVLKRKFDDEDEKEDLEDLEDRSLPVFDDDEGISLLQQSKKIKVEEVKTVLKEVEDTQRKCKKIIEQLKDITK